MTRCVIRSAAHCRGLCSCNRCGSARPSLTRQQYVLDTFMENVPDRIYFKDLESRITRANKAMPPAWDWAIPPRRSVKQTFDFFPPQEARRKYERSSRSSEPASHLLWRKSMCGPTSQ